MSFGLHKGWRTRHAIIAVAVEVAAQQQRGGLLPPRFPGFGLQCRAQGTIKAQGTHSVHALRIHSQTGLVSGQPCCQAARKGLASESLLSAGGPSRSFAGRCRRVQPWYPCMLLQVV